MGLNFMGRSFVLKEREFSGKTMYANKLDCACTMSAVSSETSTSPTASRPIRILIADDHEVMRMGIRNLLESIPNWTVYAEARTGVEAVEMALASSPDIIIMDITM